MTPEDKIIAAIERKIKTGDVVLHRPSGERWLVAYAENGYVCACGWPETLAKESDCELVDSASEENRIRLLHEIANKQGNDTRRSYARRVLGLSAALVLCLIQVAAAPLVSDGDEIASVGTTQVITPHPSWAAPLEGTQWISIAQTGWPLATFIGNGTVVSFSEVFSLASMPSSAMVTFAADDSAALWLNGSLVLAEASTAGNGYTVCSDFAPTCTLHTSVDVLPWLVAGENTLRFDVAQRGGWSYGLNYSVGLLWLDEPPLPTPEPGPRAPLGIGLGCLVGYVYFTRKAQRKVQRYRAALKDISLNSECLVSQAIARKAMEE